MAKTQITKRTRRVCTNGYIRNLTVCGLVAMMAASRVTAQTQQLITNGGFETGDFTGWTLANQHNPDDTGSNDHFYISQPGANTPVVDGITFLTAPNAAGGSGYAVTATDHSGAHALLQNFTVPITASDVALSFQMFVNDQTGLQSVVDPSGLDYTTGGTFNDNQHARVDLLRAGASDLSTTASDVLANFYLGADAEIAPAANPYAQYSFSLDGLVAPGSSYRLRFAEVDNLSAINLGVDNVSVLAMVPEPGITTLLCSLGVVGFGLRRGRRRK